MSSHGRVIWSELNTRNLEAAKSFFTTTIGWAFDAMPIDGGGTYWIIKCDEDRIGGMFEMAGPGFENVPDHWLTYIGVDDVDRRVALAREAGATVIREPWTIAGIGRVAILKVVGGAVMAWMTPIMPAAAA